MLKLFLKSVVIILLSVVLFVGLGINGAYFYIWPTNFNDQNLNVTEITQRELSKLIEQKKFYPEPSAFYFGAPNEIVRVRAEVKVNLAPGQDHERFLNSFRSVFDGFLSKIGMFSVVFCANKIDY